MNGPVTTLDPPAAMRPVEVCIPGKFDVASIALGPIVVVDFLASALLGYAEWSVFIQAFCLLGVVPGYVRSIRRIVAYRDFLDQLGLYDPRWSR